RLCGVHAFLLYQGWSVRLAAGAVDGTASDQRVSNVENRGRVSACPFALHEDQGSELHHAAHGHRPDIWNNFVPVRSAERNYQPESVHNSCQRRHLERICANADRPEVLPTHGRDDARVGPPLPQTYAGVERGRHGRQRRMGNWSFFTLEVNPHGGTTRDSDDYFYERSAEKRPGCHRRGLLQFSRRQATDEAGRPAGGIPSENS